MRQRPLGRTGLAVSELGLGCASWWGRAEFPEAEAIALVRRAIELGVTMFDTGASYSKGAAEARLGRALKGRDLDGMVVATKAGTVFERGRVRRDFSGRGLDASIERSRMNLGLDRLPLLQLHGPSLAELTGEPMETLAAARAQGRIRLIGVNSFDPVVIEAAVAHPEVDVVMVDFNVLRSERVPLIRKAAAAGKAVLAGMPLAMGHTGGQVLRVGSVRDLWYAARALKNHRREVAEGRRFAFLHRLDDLTGSQAALAWVLSHGEVSTAVFGTTRMAHLEENLAVSGRALPPGVAESVARAQARV